MAQSKRLKWPVPDEGQDPWYDAFSSMVEAIDKTVFAHREDRNLLLIGGGVISLTVGKLTWTEAIEIFSPITGFLGVITANPTVGVELSEGDILYVDLIRAPTKQFTLVPIVAQRVPTTDCAFLLGLKKDSRIYFRNGDVLLNGDSFELFKVGGERATGGGGGLGSGSIHARFTSVAIGPQGPITFDSGMALVTTTFASIAIRTDKAVTAGTLTARLGTQSGPLVSMTLQSTDNAGVFNFVTGLAAAVSIGDLLTLEVETDGSYNHTGGGFAAINVGATRS